MAAGGGGGGGGGGAAALPFRLGPGSGRLMTVRQAGRAGPSSAGGSSAGGGGGDTGAGGMSSSGRYLGRQSGEYSPPALCLALTAISSAISCCNARRSSLSFPTSWRRTRTSLARALLKSFKYLGVALGEKAAPGGLFEAIWEEVRKATLFGEVEAQREPGRRRGWCGCSFLIEVGLRQVEMAQP